MATEVKPPLMRVTHYETVEREPIVMKTVKCYTTYGVQIYVELDRQSKTATIVEWHQGKQAWIPKEFQFAKRELKYMDGWIAIFRAAEQAIVAAKAELEKFEDDEMERILEMHIALSEVNLAGDDDVKEDK